jgi:DNA-binding beta-propeller fold protein YncE
MNKKRLWLALLISLALILAGSTAVAALSPFGEPTLTLLASGLNGSTGMGSAIGPGGALYVTEGAAGRISRIDPKTGEVTLFASGLPQAVIPLGGVSDVAFIGETAYALVTLVGQDVGGGDTVGIYRVDGPDSFTVIADIGTWAIANPPQTAFDVPSGLQYALEVFQGRLLVTDGHHNRVLQVSLDGEISELIGFDNIVPTGLAVSGNTIYMAEAGAVPHPPEQGKVVSFEPNSLEVSELASGARLLVDVEFGRGRSLFALSQGVFPADGAPGAPAEANSGSLVAVDGDGGFSIVMEGLNLPTSMEIIGNTAYVANMAGEVWMIENISTPPFGK